MQLLIIIVMPPCFVFLDVKCFVVHASLKSRITNVRKPPLTFVSCCHSNFIHFGGFSKRHTRYFFPCRQEGTRYGQWLNNVRFYAISPFKLAVSLKNRPNKLRTENKKLCSCNLVNRKKIARPQRVSSQIVIAALFVFRYY